MSGPSAEGPPPRPGTAAGDGERLVSDEMVERAMEFAQRAGAEPGGIVFPEMRAALAAVAADLDRGGYDRARRDCAERLLAVSSGKQLRVTQIAALADEWSSSGRAPAGEEEQR